MGCEGVRVMTLVSRQHASTAIGRMDLIEDLPE
jgi:hypothetical protein